MEIVWPNALDKEGQRVAFRCVRISESEAKEFVRTFLSARDFSCECDESTARLLEQYSR